MTPTNRLFFTAIYAPFHFKKNSYYYIIFFE